MSKIDSDLQDKDEWKRLFDDYQEKFYAYRLKFYELGTIKKFYSILDTLRCPTAEQEQIKQLILDNDHDGVLCAITRSAITRAKESGFISGALSDDTYSRIKKHPEHVTKGIMSLTFANRPLDTTNNKGPFEAAVDEYLKESLWLKSWSNKKEPNQSLYYNAERSIELPCTFTLYFDQPFDAFQSQLDQLKTNALKLYNEKKMQKHIFLTDFLRDSDGRKLAIDKMIDKWEKCIKVYELSRQEKYRKKDGTPNYTQIGTDAVAGLYVYAHKHHVVNRTKEYLLEAERLMQSALDFTFPD